MAKKVRIGIDVGGTFTDAVVIDNATYEIIAKQKINTTHSEAEGVAGGIVKIINKVLSENNISPDDVVFIAHGTTQATNALLEGDVAQVGIIGMGTGMDAGSAKNETNTSDIELAPKKYLKTYHTFIDSKNLNSKIVEKAINDLQSQGAEVIVASEAYSVDNPKNELDVIEVANKKSLYATGGHEISQLYGLKTRTRTAVVNASLIPKMMETANMTEKAVKNAQIKSQLMIMRCDGGVMNVDEVRKRPILTMLSGLAAGVAGALMYEKISDGIFFEVGGTSVDISVIKDGKVMIKNAQVGGHKTYLRSLDVRTLAVAGGSMIKIENNKISDVGPRSAHIAGLDYECFTETENLQEPKIKFISPRESDPKNYAIIECSNGKEFSYTLAGASNLLGYVPDGDYARGNIESTKKSWQALGDYLKISAEEAAKQVMDIAVDKVMKVVNEMIEEYELDRKFITLVGGGGSGAVLVHALAAKDGFKSKVAENAPYISTIGVALAMVREQIERSVVTPTEDDIKKIREDIIEKIVKSGANEATVDVTIEIDSQKNILRAIATGSTELRSKDLTQSVVSEDSMKEVVSGALSVEKATVELVSITGRWHLFKSATQKKAFFGLFKKTLNNICMVDREGVVRLKKENAYSLTFRKDAIMSEFVTFLDQHTIYSDANATIPKVFLFYKEKMLDLTGMQTKEQLLSIIDVETKFMENDETIITVVYK